MAYFLTLDRTGGIQNSIYRKLEKVKRVVIAVSIIDHHENLETAFEGGGLHHHRSGDEWRNLGVWALWIAIYPFECFTKMRYTDSSPSC